VKDTLEPTYHMRNNEGKDLVSLVAVGSNYVRSVELIDLLIGLLIDLLIEQ
jgi:hypothetical protein